MNLLRDSSQTYPLTIRGSINVLRLESNADMVREGPLDTYAFIILSESRLHRFGSVYPTFLIL